MDRLHTTMSDNYIALVKKGALVSLLNLTESGLDAAYYVLKGEQDPNYGRHIIRKMVFDAVRGGGTVVTFGSDLPINAIDALARNDPTSFSELIKHGEIVYDHSI
jgi:hypothetical protein